MSNARELPPDLARLRVVGAADAAALMGYQLSHFRRLYRTGKVPAPIRLTGGKLGWRVRTLLDWLDAAEKREAA